MIEKKNSPGRSISRMVIATIFALLLAILLHAPMSMANTEYETADEDLSMTVENGRVISLQLGGQEILPTGESGGFYVRDYTLDPDTGLPADLDILGNLLGCSTFEGDSAVVPEPECTDCLESEGIWETSTNITSSYDVDCETLTIHSVDTTVAELVLPKDATTSTYYLGIHQDIHISEVYSTTTLDDLFCFSFDLATACGFRLEDHPEGHGDDPTYGPHEIIGRIDWFETVDDLVMEFKPEYSPGEERRIGTTEAKVFETTNDAIDPSQPYAHPTDMTSCGLRSYRPLDANYVRVGVLIHGHMPNDGVDTNDRVYFDNFAFYKAPERIPVRTGELLENPTMEFLRKYPEGTHLKTELKMSAEVGVNNTAGRDSLRISGKIKNQGFINHPPLQPRALDLGFSFPIDGMANDLVWWDDARHSEVINESSNLLPFRMTGSVDFRPELKHNYQGYSYELDRLRGESTQVSAYPFSVLDITTGNETRALSFGDDLAAPSVAVSHFGYRVTDPVAQRGEYYIEFRLGALEEGTIYEPGTGQQVPVDTTPFSFILFRSDDPEGVTTSNFRIATDDFQTALFPDFFTRPSPPNESPSEGDWEYGGAFYQVTPPIYNPVTQKWELEDNTFNNNAEAYGLRYTQETFTGNADSFQKMRDVTNACNAIEVSTLIYRQPWFAKFLNDTPEASRNHDYTLGQSRLNASVDPWGAPWPDIYDAQREYGLTLPGGLDLFSRNLNKNNLEIYNFPVLLVDNYFGTLDLIEEEREYIGLADENIGDFTVYGLDGLELDNTFFGASGANHLHFDTEHQKVFVGEKHGALTYSINYLEPAIPQLVTNVWYLDEMAGKLADIDEHDNYHGDGTYGSATNLDHELLSVNANEPNYGGSKHGIIRADIAGFESSMDNANNRTARSQNFRRTMARDKNMSRLISPIDTSDCILDVWPACPDWDNLWYDENSYKTLVMYETAWIALAWGFMPSIHNIFPEEYTFYQQHVLPIFGDDTIPPHGLALTSIFKELHHAGWRPRTQVEVDYIQNLTGVDLFVERFGDVGWGGNAVYFTILNNDNLSLTPPKLAKMYGNPPHARKSVDEVMSREEFAEYEICEKDFECTDFPAHCPTNDLEDLGKEFYLQINNAGSLGLMFGIGNLTGVQLVYRPENSLVCNWSAVRDWTFTEGYPSQYYSLLRILAEDRIVLGGPWPSPLSREALSIPDNVLYVFKLSRESKVDNGDDGGGDERSETDGGASTEWRGARYMRCGASWQTYDTAGYNGSVDAVSVADVNACAYFAINTTVNGTHEVMVHFPVSGMATSAARYDVYVTDYLPDSDGEFVLGEPRLSRVIDQSDGEAYAAASDEEGFISIGTVDVSMAPNEIRTIVVKISPGRNQASVNPSALLVADAVMIKEAE